MHDDLETFQSASSPQACPLLAAFAQRSSELLCLCRCSSSAVSEGPSTIDVDYSLGLAALSFCSKCPGACESVAPHPMIAGLATSGVTCAILLTAAAFWRCQNLRGFGERL